MLLTRHFSLFSPPFLSIRLPLLPLTTQHLNIPFVLSRTTPFPISLIYPQLVPPVCHHHKEHKNNNKDEWQITLQTNLRWIDDSPSTSRVPGVVSVCGQILSSQQQIDKTSLSSITPTTPLPPPISLDILHKVLQAIEQPLPLL